jgi:GDP-D-mannose 3', 5'-epimerase
MVQAKKRVACLGGGGFIGHHLISALKAEGYWVRGVDLHLPEFEKTEADEFSVLDLRSYGNAIAATQYVDEVYALAADMGGMGYISSHNADILTSNLAISLNTVRASWENRVSKLFYSSSACVYPDYRQRETDSDALAEHEAYPADPQDGYGWEKLTTEKLLDAYRREGRLDVRVGRYHNIFGPLGTWRGGREKAPAALCRKVADAADGGSIEVWNDGLQTRSFCYADDCVEGTLRLMRSSYHDPLNLGSDRLITINGLADLIIKISGKTLSVTHGTGPQGVRGRNSDNALCRQVLGWEPSVSLETGLKVTYEWVKRQVEGHR